MKLLTVVLAITVGTAFQGTGTKIRGVCAIDEQAVACWDARGHGLPDLTADVRRRVEAVTFPLSFVPGRKNRFLIVEQGPVAWTSVTSVAGRVQSYELGQFGGSSMSVYRVAADPMAATGTLSINVGRTQGKAAELRLREGAKAVVDGIPIQIGKIQENPDGRLGSFVVGSRQWPFVWGRWRFPVERRETSPQGGLQFEAIGRDGKPIRFVDGEGRPVDEKTGEAYWKEMNRPGHVWSTAPIVNYAAMTPSGYLPSNDSSLFWVGTSIDPKAIAKLRVRRVESLTETLGPFALDPVQANGP